MQKNILYLLCTSLLLMLTVNGMALDQNIKKQGVYEYVIQNSQMAFEEASTLLEGQFADSSFTLLAKHDSGVPENCEYRSRIFILYQPNYANQILQINRLTAPFAMVDRINIFEDENGLHIAMVNSFNINRTILMEDEKHNEISNAHKQELRKRILAAGIGEESRAQFGQFRKKGHIGKTMGVMAGGSFDGKIKNVADLPEADFDDIVAKLTKGLNENNDDWGMHIIYRLNLDNHNVTVFGTSSAKIESKSSEIVKAGSDKSRKNLTCAGGAHAAGYPIEIVVSKESDGVKVRLVNIMFRMKMYFEDAGKWAFMKNMGMPGSIQDELQKQINTTLELE